MRKATLLGQFRRSLDATLRRGQLDELSERIHEAIALYLEVVGDEVEPLDFVEDPAGL